MYVIMLIPSSFRETPDTPIRSESALSAIAREALILALFVLIPLPSVLVTLVKGKVAVTLDQKKTISLSPGEKIDYNLATSLYNVNKTNTYKWCSWKDGILIFRDDPLEYVFKRLGQTYNVEFILKDAELGKYSYKATFEGESLNEILRLLEMSAPIRCKEVSNRNTNNEKFEKQRIEVSRTMQ